jgi:hypothetical protein
MTTLPKVSSILWKNLFLYTSWIIIHFLSAHLYLKLCVSDTIIGFFITPFLIAAPHCVAIRWIITKSGDTICMMWMIIGNIAILHIDWVAKYANESEEEIYEIVEE